jgi:hypothetical protein
MHKMLTLTRPQTTASRSEATAVHGSRHTAPSHSLQAAMACRARKTVLWLVCKDPSRSLLGASRITCRALKGQITVRRLGEVRLPISTPVRLFPAVGRWGSPRRCAHPHGDAHQQNHWRKKKSTLMGELSTATASRKPCSLQRKRRAFRVACTCFFWNNWESDNYSECPLVLLPQHPSRMHRKEYGRLPFLRVPELFHVSARLRFRVVDHVSTPRRKAAHTSTDTHHVRR